VQPANKWLRKDRGKNSEALHPNGEGWTPCKNDLEATIAAF